MFRNTLTANDKYPLRDSENLSTSIQTQLYSKPKTFYHCFVLFLMSTSDLKHFEKKDDSHSYFISEITDCVRLG